MKNLGRVSLFFIFFTSTIFASVIAKVNPNIVYTGDTATYSLTISGGDIKKPNLSDICGNNIVSTGSQTSISMINGDYKKSYTLTYDFVPTKSCVIGAIGVSIDSKIEKSNTVYLEVKPMSQDLSADFVLSLKISKKELYVGEPFTLTLLLKQKQTAQVVDSKFVAPNFKGFWIKNTGKAQRMTDGAYSVTKLVYTLAAQRDGNLSISPAQIKIATNMASRNSWGAFMPQVRWKSYYSNTLNIDAKALPDNAKIIGDFKIETIIQKTKINANEALNLTLKIVGNGNLEDIDNFKPYIKNVNVFDEKIKVKNNELTQKLAFVSDENFTIPAFTLSYFSTKTKQIQVIKTQPIDIVVNGAMKKAKLEIKRDETKLTPKKKTTLTASTNSINILWLFISFAVGIGIGILIMLIKPFVSSKKSKKIDFKNEKLLLIKLLPFKDDVDVKKIVDTLESNLYSEKKENIDKKELDKIIKLYDIS